MRHGGMPLTKQSKSSENWEAHNCDKGRSTVGTKTTRMEVTMEEHREGRNKIIQSAGLLTIDELAQFLQVKKSWVYGQTRVARRTGFPVIRCGKYVRFKLDDVLKWLNNSSNMVAR